MTSTTVVTVATTSYNEGFVNNNYRRSIVSNPQAHLERFGEDWNKLFRAMIPMERHGNGEYKVSRKRTLKSYRKNMCDHCFTIRTHTGACNCG